MTKEDIFRITLACFNQSYDKIGEEALEVSFCNSFLRSAELFCARAYAWSFLQKRVQFTDDDKLDEEPFNELKFVYTLPSDCVQVSYLNSERNVNFKVLGKNFFTDIENPELTYISGEVDYDTFPYPDDYGYLLAYRLAMEIAQFIAPESSTTTNQIQQKFLLSAQTLQASEKDMQRKKNPSPLKYVY